MPAIYTTEWYEALQKLINSKEEIASRAPKGAWVAIVEMHGDDTSPYLKTGEVRKFAIRIEDGVCVWYKEVDNEEGLDLDYRFVGTATVFDEVAGGVVDPIDAGLDGRIKIRGDMRFLLRQAELVKEVLDVYTAELDTEWPKGKPPY